MSETNIVSGCWKEGRILIELVHDDPPRQHSFGTTLEFTGLVPADSRQHVYMYVWSSHIAEYGSTG